MAKIIIGEGYKKTEVDIPLNDQSKFDRLNAVVDKLTIETAMTIKEIAKEAEVHVVNDIFYITTIINDTSKVGIKLIKDVRWPFMDIKHYYKK